jgi:hypothetical protein
VDFEDRNALAIAIAIAIAESGLNVRSIKDA